MEKAKILVLEEELIVGEDLSISLREEGYEVVAAVASVDEALLKCHETKPDVILIDSHLRGFVHGLDAARRIRSETDAPVIYLTAFPGDPEFSGDLLGGTTACVTKPLSITELCGVIDAALMNRGRRQP